MIIPPNGGLKTYLMLEDAIVTMREIDADALLYDVPRPFQFKFKETNELFKFNPNSKYKGLSFSGEDFSLENFSREKKGDFWEIILQ